MNRPRITRWLRVSWTAFWGVAAVALCVLWVRSYWSKDELHRFKPNFQCIASEYGDLVFADSDTYTSIRPEPWQFETEPIGDVKYRGWRVGRRITHWFPITLAAAIAILPWIRSWRFSLRTLLIVMTLVAVGLSVVVYLTKTPATPPLEVGDFGAPSLSR